MTVRNTPAHRDLVQLDSKDPEGQINQSTILIFHLWAHMIKKEKRKSLYKIHT